MYYYDQEPLSDERWVWFIYVSIDGAVPQPDTIPDIIIPSSEQRMQIICVTELR